MNPQSNTCNSPHNACCKDVLRCILLPQVRFYTRCHFFFLISVTDISWECHSKTNTLFNGLWLNYVLHIKPIWNRVLGGGTNDQFLNTYTVLPIFVDSESMKNIIWKYPQSNVGRRWAKGLRKGTQKLAEGWQKCWPNVGPTLTQYRPNIGSTSAQHWPCWADGQINVG